MPYGFSANEVQPLLMEPAVGDWIEPEHNTRAVSATPVADAAKAQPIWIPSRMTFDRIGIEVVTADATPTARLGIFAHNASTGRPGAVVLDAGTVTLGSVGVRTITINQALNAGLYYLAVVVNGVITTLTLRRMAGAGGWNPPDTATWSAGSVFGAYSFTAAGAYTDNPVVARTTVGQMVGLRRSA